MFTEIESFRAEAQAGVPLAKFDPGNKMASYVVVAQAFREQALLLEHAAAPLQQSIPPLVRVHIRILQQGQFSEMFRRTAKVANGKSKGVDFVRNSQTNGQRTHASLASSKPYVGRRNRSLEGGKRHSFWADVSLDRLGP